MPNDPPMAAYPPPQLLITLSGPHFLLEPTDGTPPPTAIDARDTEALLAAIGRWAFSLRSSEGAANV